MTHHESVKTAVFSKTEDSSASTTVGATSPGATPITPSFRNSVYLIPTPGADGKRPAEWRPFIYRWWAWGYHSGIMLVLAVAIEVAVHFGKNGYKLNQTNVLSFGGHVSAQFLLSFFPTLLMAPVAFVMNVIWFWFRVYQPYIALSHGDASAKHSVNQNYLQYNKIQAIWNARKNGHRILYTTGILSLGTLLFQPLGSSFFELRDYVRPDPIPDLETRQSLGISVDAADLTPYVAAAGYVSANVAYDLGDPPFVDSNWTVAAFQKPANIDYAAVPIYEITSVGVKTTQRCSKPVGNVNVQTTTGQVTLSATAEDGFGNGLNGACTGSATFMSNSSTQQYGAVPVGNCATNGSVAETIQDFQPVMFWFYNDDDTNNPLGAAVFCAPQIEVAIVQANVTLSNMTLIHVRALNDPLPDNNVTGGTQSGRANNGLFFSPPKDDFVKARADTIKSVLPGAILKAAKLDAGIPKAFSDPQVFLDKVNKFYLQHLAISAQGVYFTDSASKMPTNEIRTVQRLAINEPTAHVLAALLAVTSIMTTILHVKHRRARKNLYLTHCPGSIASTVAMTGRSGFGEILVPYDTQETIKEKLGPLRFRLDARTGAILADSDDAYEPRSGKRGSRAPLPPTVSGTEPKSPLAKAHFAQEEEMQMRLLGPQDVERNPSTGSSTYGGPKSDVSRDRASKVTFVDRVSNEGTTSKASTPGGGPGGLLDVPYAWEPLPELHRTGPPVVDDRDKTP